MITFSDFEKIEIRVGTILDVEAFEKARKPALQLKIDFGSYGIKQSSAQIKTLYGISDLIGTQVIAVTNFPPKQIANFMSEVLVLGIHNEENDVVLMLPERTVPNGSRLC